MSEFGDKDIIQRLHALLRNKSVRGNCEDSLLLLIDNGTSLRCSELHENLPASQLAATFTVRRDIQSARETISRWSGLDELVTALHALGNARPFSLSIEADGRQYVVFLANDTVVGVICSPT